MKRKILTLMAIGAVGLLDSTTLFTACADDRTDSVAPAAVSAGELNKVIGAPLFSDNAVLWDEKASSVARRLGMPRESRTSRQSSYRKYPSGSSSFLGARPFSIALYGEAGKMVRLSLVFANKGDFFAAEGGGEDHFKKKKIKKGELRKFREAMRADEKAVTASLSGALGEPSVQSFGEGKARQRVERWDWNGHAFLLAEENNEYVSLQVEPTASADERGKVKRASDSAVRERIRANVERRPNGDVVVGDIPMVDQGPKGYCVPATFERCMRHVDVPADMYLLAMVGESDLGGGTGVDDLVSAVQRDVRRKGRSVKSFTSRVKATSLARYLDDGIPIIWSMNSSDAFNEIANRRTRERKFIKDWEAWAKQVRKEQRKARDLSKDDSNSHVAIIIGYNKETGEIAFSDSWGNAYRERWVGEKEAQEVSEDRFVVILP